MTEDLEQRCRSLVLDNAVLRAENRRLGNRLLGAQRMAAGLKVAGIVMDESGKTHAFESDDDFRAFISDHRRWRRATWCDAVEWHPARTREGAEPGKRPG